MEFLEGEPGMASELETLTGNRLTATVTDTLSAYTLSAYPVRHLIRFLTDGNGETEREGMKGRRWLDCGLIVGQTTVVWTAFTAFTPPTRQFVLSATSARGYPPSHPFDIRTHDQGAILPTAPPDAPGRS
jgi:hypothetical protein